LFKGLTSTNLINYLINGIRKIYINNKKPGFFLIKGPKLQRESSPAFE